MTLRSIVVGVPVILLALSATGQELESDSQLDRLLGRVELIARHHVESPSTQQMVLTLARALYQAQGQTPPADLTARVSKMNRSEEWHNLLQSILEEMGDPNAVRFATEALRRSLPGDCVEIPAKEYVVREQLAANRYVGIGIVLGKSDGVPTAMKVFPGGPLDRVGGRDGDQIWTIDGDDVRKEDLKEVIDLLRGPRGSQLRVGLVHRGSSRMVEKQITRDVVPLRALKEEEILEKRVAYLSMSQFQASVTHELRSLEPKLRQGGIQAIILDLRNLRPGRVHDVMLLADALLQGGQIGTVDERGISAGEDAILSEIRLALLVDRTTRGSLEWLAASLQQNKRAIIVGDLTPGEPWGYDGFKVPGEDVYLVIPNQLLGLASGASMVRFGVLHRLPRYVKRQSRDQWGVVPDVWVGGEVLNAAVRAGFKPERFPVEQAKEALMEALAKSEPQIP